MGSSVLPNEVARLAAVEALAWPDASVDQGLGDIIALAAEMFGARHAVISLVERDQVTALASHGVGRISAPRDLSFCTHAIHDNATLTIRDAANDPRFAHNPFVVGLPGIRFYAGALLRSEDGLPVGTLCVFDTGVREFTAAEQLNLERLARMTETRLHARALKKNATQAAEARAAAEARVQGIMQEAIGAFVACDRLALNLDGRVLASLSRIERELDGASVKAAAEVSALRDLIGDLSAAARIDRASPKAAALFEPSALLWTVAADLTMYASQRGVEFDLRDTVSGVEMLGDSWRFEELLEGLLSDCIDGCYGALKVDCSFEAAGHAHLVLRVGGETDGPAPWRLSARSRELIDSMAGCWELSRQERRITVLVPARLRTSTRSGAESRANWGPNVLPFSRSKKGSRNELGNGA
jgi:hypothetical protein